MEINKDTVKQLFEENGYYISDYILAKTYIAIRYLLEDKTVGQKIYSACLDGPSGAGKTHFVSTYCKVISKILNRKVRFINFQLDAETSKSDLYEDIDVVATFEGALNKIRIPGKIVEAIKAVNNGEIVVLKMDEYDKARDATDSLFNNFLQEALVNTTQHGDVYVDEKTSGKLQVFLCKNDQRAELSEPMVRRNRILRLGYMIPERLYRILYTFSEENSCSQEIVNLVMLLYEEMFRNKEMYNKLPSCSECQQAIMDAELLLSDGSFSQNDIYINIIENMLKFEDDIKTFESLLEKNKTDSTEKLSKFITKMKESNTHSDQNNFDFKSQMASTIFEDERQKLQAKVVEMENLISEYKAKFKDMEKKLQEAIDAEIERISLKEGKLISTQFVPNVAPNFEDESANIKRGHNVFEFSSANWTDIADLHIVSLSHPYFIKKVIENINELGVTLYENGIILKEDGDLKLIVVRDIDIDNLPRYRIMATHPIIPSTYLQDIINFFDFAYLVNKEQPKTAEQITDELLGAIPYNYDINALVYNDDNSLASSFESIDENIYHIEKSGIIRDSTDYSPLTVPMSCVSPENAILASKKIMTGYQKVKTNE